MVWNLFGCVQPLRCKVEARRKFEVQQCLSNFKAYKKICHLLTKSINFNALILGGKWRNRFHQCDEALLRQS